MPDRSLPVVPHEWQQMARSYADQMGFGPLDSLPEEQWRAVLQRVEFRTQTEGFVLPDGWQAALAKQVGRPDA